MQIDELSEKRSYIRDLDYSISTKNQFLILSLHFALYDGLREINDVRGQ